MCGICGELRFDGSPADMSAVQRMSDKIARRGPDHAGTFSDGPLGFAHRRLAIIDLTASADQPMVDAELQSVLVFNGTIYNYKELRAELVAKGYRFFSESDSEVILKAYHAWGEHCVQRLFGMFAFAVWDMRAGRLFLARDRFGIKPLYYSLDGSRLRFASSLQALLAAGGVDTGIDKVALHHHFTLHAVVPAPRTILAGVSKLPPAATMTVTPAGQVGESIYWSLDATRPAQAMPEADWLSATREVLSRAVERHRLAADVPVGVLLSGGLDSSLLVGLLADHVNDLQTFSMGFETPGEDTEKADEFEFSDQVARQFKTRHHKYLIPYDEVLRRLPEAVRQMAEPMVSQDVIAFYLLGERVSKQVKVVLCGQGADEVFGGYFWYPRMAATEGSALERFRAHYFDRDHAEYLEMVSPAYHLPDVTADLVARALSQPQADTFIDQVLRFDATTLVVDDPVKRVDNMAMAWGLESRVPFLDHELVELVARMPPELKLEQGGKFPLKAMARGLISDAVIDRPKGYFPVPVLKHVSGEFLALMRGILDSDACIQRGLYQRPYVEKLLAAPEAWFTRIQGSKLWHLALLELWLQLNVDERASTKNFA
ncbi:MAG: N-acetylglutaminylglutamine amidotransferase [Methylibium sp.]|uniref:N-acetylglutaminylglutamine amidotransferase n=1 Tax=Methylibium sp. TaxID=2067992 RepID=UPI0018381112|nr:N-acetylglutaminylglutamine amidotransferase [Methylibium sp.]MBA2724137.1 N-acetylglutaminylglutamine amidotransferase [Methylibium sp.]MBA3591125.1 N-acetylglutaminylglutamine amidotransferase [Methylibium sp.]